MSALPLMSSVLSSAHMITTVNSLSVSLSGLYIYLQFVSLLVRHCVTVLLYS